jgi:MFS family permease
MVKHTMNKIWKLKKENNTRPLSAFEKKMLALLGLPTFGLALSVTVVVTYVPLLAKNFTHSVAVIGLVIASEGIVALLLPILAGSYSDHLHTRVGGRLPFLIIGAPISALMLVWLGFANSIWELIAATFIFFMAYYLSYEPYRALYPDMVDDAIGARAQSTQALWRGIGTGVALAIGSYLLAIQDWLPFLLSAVLSLGSIIIFLWVLLKKYGVPKQHRREPDSLAEAYRTVLKTLKEHHDLRNFVIANTFWELTLSALKSFIILYLTIGLGFSRVTAATVITATAVVIFLASPLSGKLADSFGSVTIMRLAIFIFGIGLLVPTFTTTPLVGLIILPLVAFGGSIVLSLPYALLMPMMPKGEYGRITGIYSTSRGIGIMFGPVLAGASISLGKNVFLAQGYSAMWLVCGTSMLLSAPFLFRIRNIY